MHTGQPGPMMTSRSFGNALRSPYRAIACSWLPQTCITATGDRPICLTVCCSLAASAAARAGSRNFSSRAASLRMRLRSHFGRGRSLDFTAYVVRHQVVVRRFAQQLLVHPQRAFDVVLGNASNRVADVVQDVVAWLHSLVDELEPHAAFHAEEVDNRLIVVNLNDPSGYTEAH